VLLREWALARPRPSRASDGRAASLLPPRDSWLGSCLCEAARAQGQAGAQGGPPPPLGALVERLLLQLAPLGALGGGGDDGGGGGEGECIYPSGTPHGWEVALASLEDAAERMLDAAGLPASGSASVAVAAADLLMAALLCATPAQAEAEAAARGAGGALATANACEPSPPALPLPPARDWAAPSAALLAGEAAVPLPLLQAVRLRTLLRLLAALSAAGGSGAVAERAADCRAAFCVLLLQRCAASPEELLEVGGESALRALAADGDARVAYAADCHLLGRLAAAAPGAWRAGLRRLALRAQAEDDVRLLENPHFRRRALEDQ
jgi:hypothetical protein